LKLLLKKSKLPPESTEGLISALPLSIIAKVKTSLLDVFVRSREKILSHEKHQPRDRKK